MQGPQQCVSRTRVSRKRVGDVTTWQGIGPGEGLDASVVNSRRAKRSRSASDSQIAFCISSSEHSGIPRVQPAPAMQGVAALGHMASAHHTNHRSSACTGDQHPHALHPHPAFLETFRPFLQQLAAGIVAGFAATKAQKCSAAGADAATAATTTMPKSVIAVDAGCRTGLAAPPLLPQPIMQQLMLMMANTDSFAAVHPASSQPEIPPAPDAVVVVSKKGPSKPSSKQEGNVAARTAAAEGDSAGASALCCSAAQGVNDVVLFADMPASAIASQSGGTGPADLSQEQMKYSNSSSQILPPSHEPQISLITLDLRDGGPQRKNSNTAKSASLPPTGRAAAAAAGRAAAAVPKHHTSAAPPPGTVSARNSRAPGSGMITTTVPNAADVQNINSIRQHVMLLEASLGNMSPQVASAYLFLADVLEREGSQWSVHHAARARARAMNIIGTAGRPQLQVALGAV